MITFEVLVWENDYRHVLSSHFLDNLRQNLNSDFSCKRLLVNQVISRHNVNRLLKNIHFFDEVVFVQDYFSDALDSLQIDNSFSRHEEQYSRGQFVGLAKCDTQYLFHINADIEISNRSQVPFVKHGVEVLQNSDEILAFSPKWAFKTSTGDLIGVDGHLLERKKTLTVGDREYSACKGFSDNCFLVDAPRLRSINWSTVSNHTNSYPIYAGNSFEKRIANYVFNSSYFRAIDSSVTFINTMLPRNTTSKLLSKYNRYRWNRFELSNLAQKP